MSTARIFSLLTTAALLVVFHLATASPAHARVRINVCKRQSQNHVVKTYSRGAARLPLRCGSPTWGFRHITHRWNVVFDKAIALTIARGEQVGDVQQDGGTAIYALFNKRCQELFRVIYNGGAYRGTAVQPQGIITAYAPILEVAAATTTVASTRKSRGILPAGPYRTDCPVIQGI